METPLAIVADTIWFTPSLLVLVAMMALLFEVVHRKSSRVLTAAGPRPPGESLRLNLSDLNERLIIRLLITVSVAVITGMVARAIASGQNHELVYGVMFTGSSVALALTLWTWTVVNRWRNSHRGLEGERRVGRELNLLMLDGCRVFHDLTTPKFGNIDHIIVAHHAIFVVETMTIKPASNSQTDPEGRVIYNGKELRFPKMTTDHPIKRAARNARWFAHQIQHTTGLRLPVHPILALPDWTVERTGNGTVIVLNPREISSVVVDRAATPLYEAQRQRIINLLDEQCQCTQP